LDPAVKACLAALGAPPEGANLGLLYATAELSEDLSSILTSLCEQTCVESWVGTVGLGIAASGVEYHGRPAIAVLVGALPEDSFRVFEPVRGDLRSFKDTHGAWVAQHHPVFGIVHGDPRTPRLDGILEELTAATSTFLVGGLTAGPDDFPQIAGQIGAGAINKAEQNVIMTIDGRPALEVFKEDIGELLARDLRRVGGYIYAAFPVAGTDTGDYLVRNLVGIDLERGWIAVGELVEEGKRLMFCRRDHESAEQDLKRMLADVKRRAETPPKAAVYYSCVARGPNLFGPQSEELKLVRDALGDLPLVGFYANGEISNNRLYGYTGVLALFL
jgi:small ligand-binding sensory domain FIST